MNAYRKGVGIFLLNKNNKLWVGSRIDFKNNYWQMPQGGIDGSESEKQAMKRELGEEVGIKKNYEILAESKEWFSYDLPYSLKNVVWDGKYVGQVQKWFACKFYGNDNEIDLETHKPEFLKWKWIDPKEVMNFVVPFKKKLYKSLLEEFRDFY